MCFGVVVEEENMLYFCIQKSYKWAAFKILVCCFNVGVEKLPTYIYIHIICNIYRYIVL